MKDGLDITKYFTNVPYVFTSQKSFTQQSPAQESIETLEDSIINNFELNLGAVEGERSAGTLWKIQS